MAHGLTWTHPSASAILACVQATTTPAQATDPDIARHLAVFVGYVMQTCGRDVMQLAAEFEVSFSQMKALHRLRDHDEPVSVKELGDQLGLSLAAMSRAADGLVQRGLVNRIEDPQDRRVKRLSVTDAGDEFVTKIIQARLAGIEDFVATLSDKERAQLDKALAPIVARPELAEFAERKTR
jgi:DNA-binding MarR family transcriptional regulator